MGAPQDPFTTPRMAEGYARTRPDVHSSIVERIRELLGGPVERALDIGSGAGLSTRALSGTARRRIGIEPVQAMVRCATAVAPGADFVIATAEALPVRDACIDLITAAGSLNYVDPDRFFPEATRVLAPGGRLVVYDFAQGNVDGWVEQFLQRYPHTPGHAREITPASLASIQQVFRVEAYEEFETAIEMTADAYLEYALTETNVARLPEEEVRAWCRQTLAAVFQGASRDVLFRGYIAYLGAHLPTVRGRLVNPNIDLDRTSALLTLDDELQHSGKRD